MTFEAHRNPTNSKIAELIKASAENAARMITDPRNGDRWVWPAEQATHAEGAGKLEVPYSRKPGEGDILTLD